MPMPIPKGNRELWKRVMSTTVDPDGKERTRSTEGLAVIVRIHPDSRSQQKWRRFLRVHRETPDMAEAEFRRVDPDYTTLTVEDIPTADGDTFLVVGSLDVVERLAGENGHEPLAWVREWTYLLDVQPPGRGQGTGEVKPRRRSNPPEPKEPTSPTFIRAAEQARKDAESARQARELV